MSIKNFTITTTCTQLQLAYHCIYKLITRLSHIIIICHTHIFLSTIFFALKGAQRGGIIKNAPVVIAWKVEMSSVIQLWYSSQESSLQFLHQMLKNWQLLFTYVLQCNQHVQKANWDITVVLSPCKTGHQLSSVIVLPFCFSKNRTLMKAWQESNRLPFSLKGVVSAGDLTFYLPTFYTFYHVI